MPGLIPLFYATESLQNKVAPANTITGAAQKIAKPA
jgi:hypothetical protein